MTEGLRMLIWYLAELDLEAEQAETNPDPEPEVDQES